MRVDTGKSGAFFSYPFVFEPSTFRGRAEALEGAKGEGRKGEFPLWEPLKPFVEDLLPHLREYLGLEEGREPTALLLKMTYEGLRWLGGAERARWTLKRGGQKEIPFKLEGVELWLFRSGAGLLVVEAKPDSEAPKDWLDFACFFRRFTWEGRKVLLRAERRVGPDRFEPFFPEIAGGLEAHREGEGSLFDIISGLLQMARLPGEDEKWWEEPLTANRLLSFVVAFLDGWDEREGPLFIYRLRRFFRSDEEIAPTEEDLRLDCETAYVLPFCERMWFTFGLEGGGFVAFDAPEGKFFQETLPKYVAESYRLLFNLAVHQWLTLMGLSKEVAEHWLSGSEEEREEVFSRIRDRFLEFTARGFFAHATQTSPRQRFYEKWQETFGLERLYREVASEVREMHDYLVARRQERMERMMREADRREAERDRLAQRRAQQTEFTIGVLGFSVAIVALAFGFLDINIRGLTAAEGLPLETAFKIAEGAVLLLLLVLLFVLLWRKRSWPKGEETSYIGRGKGVLPGSKASDGTGRLKD